MLREFVQLCPGGFSLTLGNYFVAFKYLFSILFLTWAIGALRWPRRCYLLGGTLFLALGSFLVLGLPLGRPYGLVEKSPGLQELGDAMVVVARGSTAEGRLVREPNPNPLWGLLLAVFSGFAPERAWKIYTFIPIITLLGLGVSVAWFLGHLEENEGLARGVLPSLGAFFVLFLSSHRLSFLQDEGPFWTEYIWLTPRIGVALAALTLCLRLLSGASALSLGSASVFTALLGWLEPRLALVFVLGALVWILREREKRVRKAAPLALGLLLFAPFRALPAAATLPPGYDKWYGAVDRLLSVTLDFGLVFVLAAVAVVLLFRTGRGPERLLAASTAAALSSFALASFMPAVARALDPRVLDAYVRLSIAMAGAYGAYQAVFRLGALYPHVPAAWSFVPRCARSNTSARLGLAGLLALSLPWCFPYWWEPVLMDPTYVDSLPPISRRILAMNEAIRQRTDADAVFVAGPFYAPWIPALSGRRVLLAGTSSAPFLAARRQAEDWFVHSSDPDKIASAARAWGLTHLAWGRLDQPTGEEEDDLIVDFSFFEGSSPFEEIYRLRRWIRIFEYRAEL